jgi:hypothetical protein
VFSTLGSGKLDIKLTLNLGHSAGQKLLLGSLVLEVGKDLVDDSFCELSLLALLHLLFVADPAVEDGLDLRSDGNLLLLNEGLGLELGGFLREEKEGGSIL